MTAPTKEEQEFEDWEKEQEYIASEEAKAIADLEAIENTFDDSTEDKTIADNMRSYWINLSDGAER